MKFGIVGAIEHPQIDYGQVNYSKAPYTNAPTQVINYVSCHDDMCLTDKLRASMPGKSDAQLQRYAKLAQTIVFTSQGVPFMFAGEEIFRDKKGVHNSFVSPDSINAIDWGLKHKNRELFDYYRSLIALRKAHPAFRMASGDEYEQIVVAFNGNDKSCVIPMPQGKWHVLVDNGKIDLQGTRQVTGSQMAVAPHSALIMAR